MSEIVIPSPSVLLSSPVQIPQQPPPARPKKRVHRKADSVSGPKLVDPTRPKQTKSRNGCQTCKLKRLKCDETKPTCNQCKKRGVECGGYVQRYKWRPFDEQNVTFKSLPTPRASKKQAPRPSLSKSASNSTSPDSLDPNLLYDSPPSSSGGKQPRNQIRTALNDIQTVDENIDPELEFDSDAFIAQCLPDSSQDIIQLDNGVDLDWDSPPDLVLDGTLDILDASNGYQLSMSLPTRLDLFSNNFDFTEAVEGGKDDSEDGVEEIGRMSDDIDLDFAMDDLGVGMSRLSNSPPTMHQILSQLPMQPRLLDDSPEMLMKRFDRFTCAIMSVRDGPTENPWRRMIMPLMHHNPIVFDAVASMACFQASRNEPALRAKGSYYTGRVLGALTAETNTIRTDVALASTLCLAFGESWDCSVSAKTGIDYIRVCKKLVKAALRQGRNAGTDVVGQNRLKFLCKTWIYIDVIARLTSVDEDVSNDFELVTNLINGPLDPEVEIDPLMGCGTTLFPIVGRVANLARKVCRQDSSNMENSLEIVSEAASLQRLLNRWRAPGEYNEPEDPTTSVKDALQTAEAYRWATLLYLHQAVPELNSPSSQELAKKTLVALANVPLESRTCIVQIYPLLAAGCEATGADREFVGVRWNSMSVRMGIGNIDRCADVVKEVWRRRDEYAARNFAVAPSISPFPSTLRPPYAPGSIDLEGFPHWAEPFNGSRSMSSSGSRPRTLDEMLKRSAVETCPMTGMMDLEYSVRGSLHWVAVMKAFDWEVLLG